jgi:nuclear cap-binding protein subunit 1
MDIELVQRFLDWFAHHLSNFGFTWKWTEWVADLDLPSVHPRKAFIVDAFDKEIRLSFASRIRGTLPPEYGSLIGSEREKDVPDFKFNEEDTPCAEQGRDLASLIRKKGSQEEFTELLDTVTAKIGKLGAVDALITAICSVGSKSLSHLLACLQRTMALVLSLKEEGGKPVEVQIVTSALDFWRVQRGNGVMVVDKLLNHLIVSPEAVVEAVISPATDAHTTISQGWTWEIMMRVVGKVVGRVKGVVEALRKVSAGKVGEPVDEEKKKEIEAVLATEMETMKNLFSLIREKVLALDNQVAGQAMLDDTTKEILRSWIAKWVRALDRRAAVEQGWFKEELARPLPDPEPAAVLAPPEPQGKSEEVKTENAMADGDMNGLETRNGLSGAEGKAGGDGEGRAPGTGGEVDEMDAIQ